MDKGQELKIENKITDGIVGGGFVRGVGISIHWQDGPFRGEDQPDQTGATVEDVIVAALSRLEAYQSTEFKCRENALAITKLEEGMHWLGARTADREARGVLGKHLV